MSKKYFNNVVLIFKKFSDFFVTCCQFKDYVCKGNFNKIGG